MIIYDAEKNDGLSELLSSKACVTYATLATPSDPFDTTSIPELKAIASLDDQDLYYVQSILVTTSWNKNDDIFDKAEVWRAKNTPTHKPTNLEHDESIIVGHITANWPITTDGILINDQTDEKQLPDKFHILTGSVIYKAYTNPALKSRSDELIREIESNEKYVSMECFFKGFDYGLIDKSSGTYNLLPRNATTAYLTKHLRAYGGTGEHENYKIGRVLRQITFSGKGFVNKPANPDSVIFSSDNLRFGKANVNQTSPTIEKEEKKDDFSKTGVYSNQSKIQENLTMSLETDIAELSAKVEAMATVPEAIKEAYTLVAALKDQLVQAESLNKSNADKLQAAEETIASMKAEFEAALSQANESNTKATEEIAAQLEAIKAELVAAQETVAGYKGKEAEMLKKEKNMKRMASLIEKGVDSESASATVEKLTDLSDEAFETVTNLVSLAAKTAKMEEKVEKKETKAEEKIDVSEVLETAEESTDMDLSIGGETEENAVDNTRAALVDFVYSRLGKKSTNKGE